MGAVPFWLQQMHLLLLSCVLTHARFQGCCYCYCLAWLLWACGLCLQALRVLRAIKPLRALTRSAGMQLIFKSLTLSLAAMGNVSIVVMLFFLIFAILGVQVRQLLRSCLLFTCICFCCCAAP
jgi:hypothetical protein